MRESEVRKMKTMSGTHENHVRESVVGKVKK